MPVREVDIHYEFPDGEDDKFRLICEHSKAGRTWMSSASVEGRTRMRFGRFERYQERQTFVLHEGALKPHMEPVT